MNKMNEITPIIIEASEITKSLAEMAKTYISSVRIKKSDLKAKRQKLEEVFMESEEYKRAKNVAQTAAKAKQEAKAKALQNPTTYGLHKEIQDLSREVKEKQLALFDYLGEYTKQTGVNEIQDNTGEVHKIEITAKIKI